MQFRLIPRHLDFVIDRFSCVSNLYDQKTIFQVQIDTFIHANIIKDEISLTIDIIVTPRIFFKKYKFHIFLTSVFLNFQIFLSMYSDTQKTKKMRLV